MDPKKLKKILLVSAIIQVICAIGFYIWAIYFPGPSCRLNNDCAGQGMTIFFVVWPMAIMAVINFILFLVKTKWKYWESVILVWLTLNGLYFIYWVILPLLMTICYELI